MNLDDRVNQEIGRGPSPAATKRRAAFAARYVPMLAKWAMSDEEYEHQWYRGGRDTSGFQIEPAPAGGCFVMATNGMRIAQIHDPLGFCDVPVILQLSKAFTDACRPKVGPMVVPPEDGCPYPARLPDWWQPDRVDIIWEEEEGARVGFYLVLVGSGAIPLDQQAFTLCMNKPSEMTERACYFKCSAASPDADHARPYPPNVHRPLLKWERILTLPERTTPITLDRTVSVNTKFLGDLQYLGDLADLVFDSDSQSIHARFRDAPNIKAAIMPLVARSEEDKARDLKAYEDRVQTEKNQLAEARLARMPLKTEAPQ